MEVAFLGFGIKSVFSESAEYFSDMFLVRGDVVGVYEDVIKVDDNADVKEIGKDVIHEVLKGCQSIGESERHYCPFIRSVVSPECGFPFVAFCDADQMIGVSEIYFCIVLCLLGSVKQVFREREWVPVLFGDLVEATVVHTKSEGSIFLDCEQNQSSVQRSGQVDKACSEMFINVFSES